MCFFVYYKLLFFYSKERCTMKTTQFEEKIIFFCSKITHFCNNHFGFGLLTTALLINAVSSMIVLILIDYFYSKYIFFDFLLIGLPLASCGFLLFLVALQSVYDIFLYRRLVFVSNLNHNPNKNKNTNWLDSCRSMVLVVVVSLLFSGRNEIKPFLTVAFLFLCITLSMYMLCVNPTGRKIKSNNPAI